MSYAPKKKAGGTDEWLMTFGDMMALLLTFFVLLVGVSSPDPGKFDKAIQSIQDALGAAVLTKEKVVERELRVEESFQQIAQDVQEVIDKGSMQDVVEVEVTERGIVLNIVGGALFRAGSAKVGKGIGPLLLGVALIVKKLPFKVLVEGHTDDTQTKGKIYPSNWELSAARAASVVRFMVDQGGLDPARFSATGYAEFRPLHAPTPENRKKNRRVEIVISREGHSG